MRFLIILLFFITSIVHAGTCTPITRINNSANSVLTSAKYNADVNTAYSAINNFDGGCTSDGTLEKDALNSTSFAVPLNSNIQGCELQHDSYTSLKIQDCYLAVNGNWVVTATDTDVTWANLNTGSEATNTTYYVYASSASTGSTLTPIISTTEPNPNGYDSSSNRAIGSFYNDYSGNIATSTVFQWQTGKFQRAGIQHSIAYLEDRPANGTGGVPAGDNAVTVRTLNSLTGDTSFVSLSSDYFTLQPGVYNIEAKANARLVGLHKAFLVNDTDNVYELWGTNADTDSSSTTTTTSFIDGVISIKTAKTYFIAHWTQTSSGANPAFGFTTNGANNPQPYETYLRVKITKIR